MLFEKFELCPNKIYRSKSGHWIVEYNCPSCEKEILTTRCDLLIQRQNIICKNCAKEKRDNDYKQRLKLIHHDTIEIVGEIDDLLQTLYKCKICNNEWITSISSLINDKNPSGCPKCQGIVDANNKRKNITEVNNIATKYNLIKLFKDEEYTVAGKKLLWMTNDEYKYKIFMSYNQLQQKVTYLTRNAFSLRNPHAIYNIKRYLSVVEPDYELISDKYLGAKSNLTWRCNNGHLFKLSWNAFSHNWRCNNVECSRLRNGGEKSILWKGGLTPIYNYLRKRINPWIKDSIENCKNKCIITNIKSNIVHHLYSYNLIVNEVFQITKLPIKIKVNEYNENELTLLRDTCLKLHYKYGLGVCLIESLHLDFHSIYGRGNNTPKQFEEFKITYKRRINMSIEEIKSLISKLNEYSYHYYVLDNPLISDKDFDVLYTRLETLEKQSSYILSSSPTQKVQGAILDSLKKVQHTEPMLSAEKSKDINDVIKFMGNQDCVLSWKLDGLTLVLKYNEGKFIQAITRGGGDEGEDVTHTVKTFSNVPLTIDYTGYLEIRGEGLVTFKDFEKINEELIANGEEPYLSPRNLAAGSVRQLDANITRKRNLLFIAFGIVKCDEWFMHKVNQFMFLESLGFTVVEYTPLTKKEIEAAVDFFKSKLEALPYLTDGLIIEFNNIAYGKAQGFTGHHTKNLYAMKWNDDSFETIFKHVELNTTRTGIASVTAIYKEVDLDGAMNTRASLHNYDIFEELQLGVGDKITVYRANGVIPQVEDNLTRSGTYKINMICPSCGGELVIRAPKEARFLFCDNEDCPAQLVNKFVHYCSKVGMNIHGFSETGIELFINEGFLKTFADIYKLEQYKSKIVKLEGWGVKSYNKLIQAIEKSKTVKMENFLFSLGIKNVGIGGAKRLTQHFDNDINKLFEAVESHYDFSKIIDFGDITAQSVHDYFNKVQHNNVISELMDYVEFKKEEKKEVNNMSDNFFKGKTTYCTGTFESYKKEQLKSILEGLGATFANGFTKSLDFLIVGKVKSSSKVEKAIKANIPVLSEDEFLAIIGGNNND